MNIAILIGVSDYGDPRANLPGCYNDVNLMYSLLNKTEKYQDILYINQNTKSEEVKRKLTEFIKKYVQEEDQTIEELFFYYTGHGQFYNEEFYYQLSNFNEYQRNSTSLKNSEIDDLLRSLNPELAIKVVDACQSGISYVKELGENKLEKIFGEAKQSFNKCYFMFSSQFNQSSLATESLSDFTKSFVEALTTFQNGDVRYVDIMDRIKDYFSATDSEQTPYFVLQANLIETFCNISESMKEFLLEELAKYESNDDVNKSTGSNHTTLKELIEKEANTYCNTPEEANSLLQHAHDIIVNFQFSQTLSDFFNFEFKKLEHNNYIPKIDVVAKSLNKENDYFIEITYGLRKFQVEVNNQLLSAAFSITGQPPEKKYRTEERTVITGYNLTEESPFSSINLDVLSKYPNLSSYNLLLLIAFSKKELTIYYYYTKYKEIGWSKQELVEKDISWNFKKFPLKKLNDSKQEERLTQILKGLEEFILDDLNEKFKRELTPKDPSVPETEKNPAM